MAIFFNEELLQELSCNDPLKYLALLEYHTHGNLAKNKYAKYKPSTKSLTGLSFLLYPEPLFKTTVDPLYKIQYIKAAAKRAYTLYKYHKILSLPLSYYPELNLAAAKSNPLLTVTNTELKFKYER